MGVIVEYRNVNDVCKSERINAVVRPCYKEGPVSISKAKQEDPFQFVVSVFIPMLGADDMALTKLEKGYTEAIRLAKAKECRKIAVQLLGGGSENIAIERLLGIALRGISEGIGEDETKVYLALDMTAQKRIEEGVPEELLKMPAYERQAISKTQKSAFPYMADTMQMITTRKEFDGGLWSAKSVVLPAELRNIPDYDSREAVRNLLWKYLPAHGYKNKAGVFKDIEGTIAKSSFYNIFDENRPGEISKNSILIIALGCKFTMKETEDVLRAGGYTLVNPREKATYKWVLEREDILEEYGKYRVELCNQYLVAQRIPPLCDDRDHIMKKKEKE